MSGLVFNSFSTKNFLMQARERNDLIVSWLTLSVAFALVLGREFLNVLHFAYAFPITLVGVGTAFVFHEMAHRNVARKFGFYSEYRAWPSTLLFALILPFITFGRFVFGAPGATYILGEPNLRQNGIISVAGPITNIILGAIFSLLLLLNLGSWLNLIFYYAAYINFFLAIFNMLPIWVLDGKKILAWNASIWALVFFSAIVGWLMLPIPD
jgi:Zn-dependent protease